MPRGLFWIMSLVLKLPFADEGVAQHAMYACTDCLATKAIVLQRSILLKTKSVVHQVAYKTTSKHTQ